MRAESALIDRQGTLVELEDHEVGGGGVDGADVALRPKRTVAVPLGLGDEPLADLTVVRLPGLACLTIHHLRVVEVRVVPVAEPFGAQTLL